MPLYGTRSLDSLLADSALMPTFASEPQALRGAAILQVMFEIRQTEMLSLIPESLHPTVPPIAIVAITHCPESPWGAFTLAEVRIGCRAAARPRAFLARCFVDTEAAARGLREGWGYPAQVAEVRLKRGYDRVRATVTKDGEMILDVALINPEPINAGDVQYLPNVQVARTMRDGVEVTRIIQVDSEFEFHKADRGKAQIDAFNADAWSLPNADPWFPISASSVICDMELPRIRYVFDPSKPAISGVERVG